MFPAPTPGRNTAPLEPLRLVALPRLLLAPLTVYGILWREGKEMIKRVSKSSVFSGPPAASHPREGDSAAWANWFKDTAGWELVGSLRRPLGAPTLLCNRRECGLPVGRWWGFAEEGDTGLGCFVQGGKLSPRGSLLFQCQHCGAKPEANVRKLNAVLEIDPTPMAIRLETYEVIAA